MFTLKLFRRVGGGPCTRKGLITKVISVDHVMMIGIAKQTVEIRACKGDYDWPFETFYIGERTPEMTAIDDTNHWGWGLLENSSGQTTEHYRPYTHG